MNQIVSVVKNLTSPGLESVYTSPGEEKINHAYIEAIAARLPLILAADMLVGIFIFVALGLLLDSWQIGIWFAFLGLSCSVRGFVNYQLTKDSEVFAPPTQLKNTILFGSAVGGFIWASVWFFLPEGSSYLEYGLVVLWQCGVLAGAAASISISKPVFSVFVASPVVVSLASLLSDLNEVSLVLSGAFLSYVLFIIPLGLHTGMELRRGVRLRIENESLETNLKLEHRKLKEQENELVKNRAREQQLIDEKVQTGHKLKAAADERLLLLESIEEGIIGINSTGKVTFANPSALRMLEYEEAEIIGVRVIRLIRRRGGNADEFIKTTKSITDCYESGKSSIGQQGEFVSNSGKILAVRISCRPIWSADKKIIGSVVSFIDISRQLEMESVLLQTQRIEAIGRITGGVAHDFNNLLTVMIGNLQFMRKQPNLDNKLAQLIKQTLDAARSGADLVSRLLGFSKEQQLDLETHDINILLLDIKSFLERVLGEKVSLKFELSEDDSFALTDKTEFQNAILNLCVNAKDAMPEGGSLKISVSKSQIQNQEYVKITIQDNGVGIPPEVKGQVFEPYFTTKDKEKGFGLGLSMVYGFVKASGGEISVSSVHGKGATFTIHLRASPETAIPNPTTGRIINETPMSGTILVVEDDDSVRNVAEQMLTDSGFEVITAKDGKSGLEKFRQHPEIDLVFSDIVMPGGMTGIDMANRILQKKPNAPILFTTGYSDKSIRDNIPKRSNIACIAKPYDTEEMPKVALSLMDKVAS